MGGAVMDDVLYVTGGNLAVPVTYAHSSAKKCLDAEGRNASRASTFPRPRRSNLR
jgi:hypothetical protein